MPAFTGRELFVAVEVLLDADFRVVLHHGPGYCGLTWISTGQLGVARHVLARTLRVLALYARAGTPVVGLEPSCTAAPRGELPEHGQMGWGQPGQGP